MNTVTDTSTTPVVSTTATKLAEIQRMRDEASALETQLAVERNAALVALPSQFGFANPKDFLKAFNAAHKGTKPVATANGRKKRVTITPERRKEIKAWMKERKDTAGLTLLAAAEFGIGVATAQIIKDEAGLVDHR